ncbi:MAG: rhodanese-like domain-containing protein [Kiritimatiellae bacterium]|nr:rhodanese-like domain-containing protein [Kiritimatiellia bacterium]
MLLPPPSPPPSFFPTALRRALLIALLAILAGVLFNALRPTPLPWGADWSHHVETRARNAALPLVHLPDLRDALASRNPPVLLDARPAADYAAAHLPAARSLPADSAEDAFSALSLDLALDAPIVAYCRDVSCDDALVLALALRDRGFSAVSLYPGGIAEWTAYKGPVEP